MNRRTGMQKYGVIIKTMCVIIPLLLLTCCTGGKTGQEEQGTAPPAGEYTGRGKDAGAGRLKLPDFTLADLAGKEYRLSDYVGRKPILLIFWTTNCRFCIAEIPELNRVFQDRSKDVEVLSINVGDSPKMAGRLVQAKGIKYPVLLDQSIATARAYSVRGVPTHVVIDLNGNMGYYGFDLSEAMKKIDGLKG